MLLPSRLKTRWVNTLRPDKYGHYFAEGIFSYIYGQKKKQYFD